jgi:dUTP pyrophosphatase
MLVLKRLREETVLPSKAHEGDAGFDVFSMEDVTIHPNCGHTFALGFSVAVPEGYVGRISERSGMASRHGIVTIGNMIDSGYRGEAHAVLWNIGNQPVPIVKGQKIAQLILMRCYTGRSVAVAATFSGTERSEGGFGSTGA